MALTTQQIILIAVAVIAALVVIGFFARATRRTRSAHLREKFGPEYDHAVRETGSRTRAERELVTRAEEIEQYDIRPLTAAERERYRGDFARIERHFVERPMAAVLEADEVVAEIMRVQGYPMGDFEKHAAHLSVKHPLVVEHYRAGHKLISGTPSTISTEDMRQAMLHYRALADELMGDRVAGGDVARDIPRENEVVSSGASLERERERERLARADEVPIDERPISDR